MGNESSLQRVKRLINHDTSSLEKAISFLTESWEVFKFISDKPLYFNGSDTIGFYPETLKKSYPAHDPTIENFIEGIKYRSKSMNSEELRKYCSDSVNTRKTSTEYINEGLYSLRELLEKSNQVIDQYTDIGLSGDQMTIFSGFDYSVMEYISFNKTILKEFDNFTDFRKIEILLSSEGVKQQTDNPPIRGKAELNKRKIYCEQASIDALHKTLHMLADKDFLKLPEVFDINLFFGDTDLNKEQAAIRKGLVIDLNFRDYYSVTGFFRYLKEFFRINLINNNDDKMLIRHLFTFQDKDLSTDTISKYVRNAKSKDAKLRLKFLRKIGKAESEILKLATDLNYCAQDFEYEEAMYNIPANDIVAPEWLEDELIDTDF